MENINKELLKLFPELFTFLDRFCPICGAPVSLKENGKHRFLVCTNAKCPYYEILYTEKEELS